MKFVLLCFGCEKEYQTSQIPPREHGFKCECGSYVVSPSGKVQLKKVK